MLLHTLPGGTEESTGMCSAPSPSSPNARSAGMRRVRWPPSLTAGMPSPPRMPRVQPSMICGTHSVSAAVRFAAVLVRRWHEQRSDRLQCLMSYLRGAQWKPSVRSPTRGTHMPAGATVNWQLQSKLVWSVLLALPQRALQDARGAPPHAFAENLGRASSPHIPAAPGGIATAPGARCVATHTEWVRGNAPGRPDSRRRRRS